MICYDRSQFQSVPADSIVRRTTLLVAPKLWASCVELKQLQGLGTSTREGGVAATRSDTWESIPVCWTCVIALY